MKELFKGLGLQRLEGDEAVYYKKDENGELEGMVSTCVDDFDLAGTKSFVEKVTKEISNNLDVSKVEDDKFRYTGIDIKKVENGIEISMDEYAESMEEIKIREGKSDEELNRDEMKVLRKYVGKFNWLSTNTRPDIAIHALELAKKQKKAMLKYFREVNIILKKVHEKESRAMFKKIGDKKDLCITGVSDASYKNDDRYVAGENIMLPKEKIWMYPPFI